MKKFPIIAYAAFVKLGQLRIRASSIMRLRLYDTTTFPDIIVCREGDIEHHLGITDIREPRDVEKLMEGILYVVDNMHIYVPHIDELAIQTFNDLRNRGVVDVVFTAFEIGG